MVRGLLEINLNLLAENMTKIRKILPPDVRFLAAVKTNAYGLGIEK
jgi:alanine racemase